MNHVDLVCSLGMSCQVEDQWQEIKNLGVRILGFVWIWRQHTTDRWDFQNQKMQDKWKNEKRTQKDTKGTVPHTWLCSRYQMVSWYLARCRTAQKGRRRFLKIVTTVRVTWWKRIIGTRASSQICCLRFQFPTKSHCKTGGTGYRWILIHPTSRLNNLCLGGADDCVFPFRCGLSVKFSRWQSLPHGCASCLPFFVVVVIDATWLCQKPLQRVT